MLPPPPPFFLRTHADRCGVVSCLCLLGYTHARPARSADNRAKAIASKNSPVPVVVDRRYDRAAPAQPTINELQAAKARALAELRGGGAALPAADAGPSTSTRPLHAVGLARLHTAVPETSAAAAATSNAWANPGKLQSVVAQQPKEPAFIPGYEPPSKPAKKAAAGGGITAAALAAAQPSGAAKKPPSELAESVAGDAASEADETKLTRAQKKALYRAEKAAAESEAAAAAAQQGGGGDARTATMSVTSDDQMSLASSDVQQHGGGGVSAHDVGAAESQLQLQPPRDYALEQACVQWLVANKVAQHVVQLQQLGFSDVLATVGVQRFGSDLVSAVCWLLEADLSQPLAALQEEAAGCTPEVDISAEMQQVLEIQGALEVPLELVQQAVVDGRGDLQAAVSLLVDSRTTSEDGTGTGNGDELAGTPPEWADVDVALLVEGMPSNLAALAAGEQLLRGRELLSALRAGEARQLEVAHAMAPQALPVASDAVLRPWSERHATTA